jgi:bifunctional non-homologous end joining protein LigD
MAKRADSMYLSGARTDNWLKIKASKRQEVVIAGFTAPRRTRPFFGALTLLREGNGWRYIGHVGTGFSQRNTGRAARPAYKAENVEIPFPSKVKDEAVATWVKPQLAAEIKFTKWTSSGEMRHPAYPGLRRDTNAGDVVRDRESSRNQTS